MDFLRKLHTLKIYFTRALCAFNLSMTSRAVCVCNNRGGVGKTFLTFQLTCAIAVANPTKKVLACDFSIYSELTAMFFGGTAAATAFGAPHGLKVCRDEVATGVRVEGLLHKLAEIADAPAPRGIFRRAFSSNVVPEATDVLAYATCPSAFNTHIPSNVYLIASAGADSFDASVPNPPWGTFRPEMGRRLSDAVAALSDEWVSVFFDTDHLASSPLTRLALMACDSVAVPCPIDTAEFQRLYKTPDASQFAGVESLFEDVMIPMQDEGLLRAKVTKMIFCKVPSVKNEASVTLGGLRVPFTPNAATAKQMDALAKIAYEVCAKHPLYASLFAHTGGTKLEFVRAMFTAFKLVPDVAKTMSTQCGVPLCVMTPQAYVTVSGISGASGIAVLNALRAEIAEIVS